MPSRESARRASLLFCRGRRGCLAPKHPGRPRRGSPMERSSGRQEVVGSLAGDSRSVVATPRGRCISPARERCEDVAMGSPQTLSESDRRIAAAWAADCAERVLWLFEAEAPQDRRPREAIARTRAFARGELDVAGEIRRRFVGGGAARDARAPAAAAAARAAGGGPAVGPIGAPALGAPPR